MLLLLRWFEGIVSFVLIAIANVIIFSIILSCSAIQSEASDLRVPGIGLQSYSLLSSVFSESRYALLIKYECVRVCVTRTRRMSEKRACLALREL